MADGAIERRQVCSNGMSIDTMMDSTFEEMEDNWFREAEGNTVDDYTSIQYTRRSYATNSDAERAKRRTKEPKYLRLIKGVIQECDALETAWNNFAEDAGRRIVEYIGLGGRTTK